MKGKTKRTFKIDFSIVTACIIAILSLLPPSDVFLYIKFAVVLLLTIVVILSQKNSLFMTNGIPCFIWLINTFLALGTVLFVEHQVNSSVALHEFERIIYYFLVIILCSSLKLNISTLVNICRALLIFHFVLQTMQFFKIGNTYEFLYNNYLQDKTVTAHIDMAYGEGFRSGSIYLNPNVYMVYPPIFLLVFLENTGGKFNIVDYIFMIVSAISVFYTGSRTGLVLFVVIFIVYLYLNRNNNKISKFVKFAIPILAIIGYIILLRQDARMLDIESGMSDSIGVKFSGLSSYLQDGEAGYFLFGSLGSKMRIPIDMEFGYIFEWWGLFGFIWYFMLIFSFGKSYFSSYQFLARTMKVIVLVASFSCSIILNMSVFPFLCLIVFTNLESNSVLNEN